MMKRREFITLLGGAGCRLTRDSAGAAIGYAGVMPPAWDRP
jgi:hypothetical protein